MNDQQRKLARHALGLPNKQHTSYRNRFCTGPDADNYADWKAMVASGEAIERTSALWGGDSIFALTLKGALAAREPKEHLSREDVMEMRTFEEV